MSVRYIARSVWRVDCLPEDFFVVVARQCWWGRSYFCVVPCLHCSKCLRRFVTQMYGLSSDSYLDPLSTFPQIYKDMHHSISEIMVRVSWPKRNKAKRLWLVMPFNENSRWSKSPHPKILTILEEDKGEEIRDMETDESGEFGSMQDSFSTAVIMHLNKMWTILEQEINLRACGNIWGACARWDLASSGGSHSASPHLQLTLGSQHL